MSATVETRRPMPGDQVTARTVVSNRDARNSTISERVTTITLPDGSLVLTKEEVALFGNGDAERGRREIKLMIANERNRPINEAPCPRSKSSRVRIATAADEQKIYELLLLDIAENAAIVAPANEECIKETIKKALEKPSIVGVIDGSDGAVIGVVMLMAQRWWWARSWYFQEIPLFVHQDHRRSDYARQLNAFQRWWVDEMTRGFGYRIYLLCGVLGTVQIHAKTAWYRRWFRQVGSVFLYPSPFTTGG